MVSLPHHTTSDRPAETGWQAVATLHWFSSSSRSSWPNGAAYTHRQPSQTRPAKLDETRHTAPSALQCTASRWRCRRSSWRASKIPALLKHSSMSIVLSANEERPPVDLLQNQRGWQGQQKRTKQTDEAIIISLSISKLETWNNGIPLFHKQCMQS
eukprot:scpid88082/ scgid28600/ 